MEQGRERGVVDAFVSITNSLVGEFDVIDLLSGLTADCAELLDISSAGLLLADDRKILHVVAASSEATRMLELFQLQREQGPCLDCFHSGRPVAVPDLSEHRDRWPQFTDAAAAAGFVSVHAVPMRLHSDVLGALGLFGSRVGALTEDDLGLAQALAHVASVALVNASATVHPAAVNEQLNITLVSRATIEQAKGLLAQLGGLDMDQAFAAMREYARDQGLRLGEVARRVVTRTLDSQAVLAMATQIGRPTEVRRGSSGSS